MLKRSFALFSVLLLSGTSGARPYNPPMARDGLEIRGAKLPVIDGRLDDEVYGRTELSAPFMSLGRESSTVNALWEDASDRYSRLKTRFQLVADTESLVVAFHAPVPAGEKARGSGAFGGQDDFVEFFVMADNGYDFTQILVDAGGHALAYRYGGSGSIGTKVSLEGLTAAAAETADGFSVEIRVPMASLGIGPHALGDVLRGNATREGPTNGGSSTWAPVGTTFNNSERFDEFYWKCRTTTVQKRRQARKEAAERLAATGKTMAFWRKDPYQPFGPGEFPDPDTLLDGAHAAEIPCGTRAIAPFVASNLGTRDYVGTFEVKGELAKLVRFREVGLVELKGGTIVADPIWEIPEGRVLRIRAGESALVWLDVDSRGLKPGRYTSEVTLHPARSGFNYERFLFTLDVSPVTLADKDPVAWAFGMYRGVMRDLGRDYGFLGEPTLPHHSFPKDASGFGELDRVIDEACRKYRESGREVWTYTVISKNSVPDALRAEFWNVAKEGFKGPATFYDLHRASGDAYDSYDGGKSTGDHMTVYRDARTGGISVSRRMEAWYEGLVDLRLLHLAGRMARTEGEKAKIRETVLLGAQRKMDFRTLRRGLMRLCETLQARRASEAAK